MKFFFPDSQDLVDLSFNFRTEERSATRLRQRDDAYAHELFAAPAYDGMLVSKGIVDGVGNGSRYTLAQRHRLFRVGAKDYFRLTDGKRSLEIMGDCGAFTYVREKEPPYTVDGLLKFYADCGFDYGISLDHVILAYQPSWDSKKLTPAGPPSEVKDRQTLTLELASKFLQEHKNGQFPFKPLGVAQGWSPRSYAKAVGALQTMGYKYIALGGMVPLKTHEILECLEAIAEVKKATTRFHLLGVTRVDSIPTFGKFGVASFDSTSPLKQAFKDATDNYYTMERCYTAIRVPQVEGNPGLQRKIKAGLVDQTRARKLELGCLDALSRFDASEISLKATLKALRSYEELYDPDHDHTEVYREVLSDQPWKQCPCDVCRKIGYHVNLFRGAERNRRRGFHNVYVFYRRLHREMGFPELPTRQTSVSYRTLARPQASLC